MTVKVKKRWKIFFPHHLILFIRYFTIFFHPHNLLYNPFISHIFYTFIISFWRCVYGHTLFYKIKSYYMDMLSQPWLHTHNIRMRYFNTLGFIKKKKKKFFVVSYLFNNKHTHTQTFFCTVSFGNSLKYEIYAVDMLPLSER